jgi:hypothetical protein
MPRRDGATWTQRLAVVTVAIAMLVVAAPPAWAHPSQFLPVGDPLEDELRLLDLYPAGELRGRLRLAHLGTRPWQLEEIMGNAPPVAGARPEVALALGRIERVLGRDAAEWFAPDSAHPPTPRLFRRAVNDQIAEASFGIEGTLLSRKEDAGSAVVSGSGLHARLALAFDHWLAYSHQILGRFRDGRRFADPVVTNTDIVVMSEETYLTWTAPSRRWAASFGRNRWSWGPGREGSLLLSRTSAPITGLTMRGTLGAYRITGMMISATLQEAAGEQLAAHRIEWQPAEALRIGGTEVARYRGTGWSWVYAIGILPYAVAQRLLSQDEPDSGAALRNNTIVGIDAAWRVAPGARLYGELAVDDLNTARGNPNKIAWQLGWDGAAMALGGRLAWGAEVSRVWRYVYTSYYGRHHVSQGRPLGFPTGPDARRIVVRATWDPSLDWQWTARAVQTNHGENALDEPLLPTAPKPDPSRFEGIVERTREIELGVRWWPAGGVDAAVRGGWRRIDNRGNVPGARADDWTAAFELRLVR